MNETEHKWSNFQTWNVHLWLTAEKTVRKMCEDCSSVDELRIITEAVFPHGTMDMDRGHYDMEQVNMQELLEVITENAST